MGLRSDGADTHAVNLLMKLDDNAYAWQSVGRSVADEPRPDTDEIILKRADYAESGEVVRAVS